MRNLKIKNVGPITGTARISFQRYCVLIGPQSNGKSTIAKILSTCMWMEKEACTTLSERVLPVNTSFKDFIEDFHRIHGYIHDDSEIVYDSEYIHLEYKQRQLALSLKGNMQYRRVKVSYMPADRNVVTMKDLEKRDLEYTNFRSFLFDWLYCRRYFDRQNMANILELGVKYYYDSEANDRQDKIIHQNGETYDLTLYDASSGMQSAVPLVVSMHFFTGKYFEVYNAETSFDTQQKEQLLARRLRDHFYPATATQTSLEVYKEARRKEEQGDEKARDKRQRMFNIYQHQIKPDSISFVLEEPEQNLFPHTQLDLVNDIIASCNAEEHRSTAMITTHSPYVLAAINILMFAGLLKEKGVNEGALKELVSEKSMIMPSEISVYSVKGGTCYSIVNAQSGLIDQNQLDTASEVTADVFDKLYRLYVQKLQEA